MRCSDVCPESGSGMAFRRVAACMSLAAARVARQEEHCRTKGKRQASALLQRGMAACLPIAFAKIHKLRLLAKRNVPFGWGDNNA